MFGLHYIDAERCSRIDCLNLNRCIFPVAVYGSSVTKTYLRGCLNLGSALAARPLRSLSNKELSADDLKEFEELNKAWKKATIKGREHE